MNSWLEPSIIATMMTSIVLCIAYGLLYHQEKAVHLKYFLIAWSIYIFRYIFELRNVWYPDSSFSMQMVLLLNIGNGYFLYRGSMVMNDRPVRAIVGLPALALPFLIFIPGSWQEALGGRFTTYLVFLLLGTVYIITGFSYLNRNKKLSTLRFSIALSFILWGIHKYDYPLLYDVPAFAPYGYLLSVLLTTIIAVAVVLLHYKISFLNYQKNEARLESLVDLLQIRSMEQLSDSVLLTAIRITESSFGFIYTLEQGPEASRLQLWTALSSSPGEGRNAAPPFILPDLGLDQAGLWGESARSQSAYLNNSYKGRLPGQAAGDESPQIQRFLSVPVVEGESVRALVYVADKAMDYDAGDVRQLQLLVDSAMKIVTRQNLEDELREAKAKAENADQLKTALMMNLSHELRTPLNGIQGMVQLLRMDATTSTQTEYLSLMEKSSQDLRNAIEDLLEYSRISKGEIMLAPAVFNLASALRNLVSTYQGLLESSPVRIRLRYERNDEEIFGDQAQIIHAVNNIISNAVKFSVKGTIEVIAGGDQAMVSLTVRDMGIGIDKKDIEHIADEFFYADEVYKKRNRGLGLGLTIAKRVIEKCGGTMKIDSEIGKGTTVTLVFPAGDPKAEAAKAADPQLSSSPDRRALSGLSILIAEDDPINLLYLNRLLGSEGAQCITAANGEEAVERLEGRSVDLVLMDINMPGMSGMEATRILRKSVRFLKLPIIAVTAYTSDEDRKRYTEAGFDDFIAKPFSGPQMLQKILQYSTA